MAVIVAVVLGRKQISDYFNILSWVWTFMGTFSVHLAPVNPGWHLEGKNVISNRMLKTLNFQTGNFLVGNMEVMENPKNDLVAEQHEEKDKTFRKQFPIWMYVCLFMFFALVFKRLTNI